MSKRAISPACVMGLYLTIVEGLLAKAGNKDHPHEKKVKLP